MTVFWGKLQKKRGKKNAIVSGYTRRDISNESPIGKGKWYENIPL